MKLKTDEWRCPFFYEPSQMFLVLSKDRTYEFRVKVK